MRGGNWLSLKYPGCVSSGFGQTIGCLKERGKIPSLYEALAISVRSSTSCSQLSFTSKEGNGSDSQVLGRVFF